MTRRLTLAKTWAIMPNSVWKKALCPNGAQNLEIHCNLAWNQFEVKLFTRYKPLHMSHSSSLMFFCFQAPNMWAYLPPCTFLDLRGFWLSCFEEGLAFKLLVFWLFLSSFEVSIYFEEVLECYSLLWWCSDLLLGHFNMLWRGLMRF